MIEKEMVEKEISVSKHFVKMPRTFLNYGFPESRTDLGILVYALLDAMDMNFLGVVQTTVSQLIEIAGLHNNNAMKMKFKEELQDLVEYGAITIYSDSTCSQIINDFKPADTIYVKVLEYVKGNQSFTKIFYEDLKKIVMLDEKNKAKILRVYALIVSHIFYTSMSDKLSYVAIDTIANATGYDRKTVMRYVEVLCENRIILGITVHIGKKSMNYYTREPFRDALKDKVNSLRDSYGEGVKVHAIGLMDKKPRGGNKNA